MNLETKNSHLFYLSIPLESQEEMKLNDYREKVARKYKGDLILNNKGHCTIGSFYASDKSLLDWVNYTRVFYQKMIYHIPILIDKSFIVIKLLYYYLRKVN